jgi:ketosteroid isomerase-like protein
MAKGPGDVVRQWFEEVWNQGRLESIDALLAPGGKILNAGENCEDLDAAQFRQFRQRFGDAFDDIRFTIEDMVEQGDKVAIYWRATMTDRASGRRVELNGSGIGRVENGQLKEAWNNWDVVGVPRRFG